MEKLDRKYVERREVQKKRETKYMSFAEQFLEQPVYAGETANLGITVTCCTFRGIPTIDDF